MENPPPLLSSVSLSFADSPRDSRLELEAFSEARAMRCVGHSYVGNDEDNLGRDIGKCGEMLENEKKKKSKTALIREIVRGLYQPFQEKSISIIFHPQFDQKLLVKTDAKRELYEWLYDMSWFVCFPIYGNEQIESPAKLSPEAAGFVSNVSPSCGRCWGGDLTYRMEWGSKFWTSNWGDVLRRK